MAVLDYIHPDLVLFLAAIFVLVVFIRLYRQTDIEVRGFRWIFGGITLFLLASFFNWFEETPLGYLMLEFTDEEGWDFIVPVYGYAPGGIMFCFGFAEWLRMSFILKKEIEQRLVTERELKAALAAAERANSAKDKFLSIMSLELKTPLTAVIGFSEIMSDPRNRKLSPAEYVEYSDIILKSSNHLLATIDDILSLAQMDAETYELDEVEFDPTEVVEECFYLMAVEAENANVKLEKTIQGSSRLTADRRLIKQIALNLLSNAIKFNDAGGTATMSLVHDPTRGFVMSVADTGAGMTPLEAKQALEPFTQFEETMTRKASGAGLGLPLVKRFAEMHGGKLEITSQKEVGTEVQVILPPERVQRA
ncbi:MAG: HAMP domain-containing histidine kinase [Kordiimonadaceae bacterium]|nr:HAMP domain-containing histidine kinase [Kordiimonadaceae bacterium]MBO6570184.1 HAMP domain-containing histidine kinase [Kordiimonadaceae bacterium]MBO6965718.1 HAMP domain-containing histidine kinase [Kordiimonadaceae bacterium]